MIKYISKRVFLLILTLIIIFVLTFFLLQLIPGYPSKVKEDIENFQYKKGGPTPSEWEAYILKKHHLDSGQNSIERFAKYIGNIFNHGTFGIYHKDINTKISDAFLKPLKYTFMIAGPAFIIGTILGIIFGFWAGYKRGKIPDILLNIFAIIFVAVPSFVLAILLLLMGSKFGWPIDFQKAIGTPKVFLAAILPITILTVTSFATLTYYIRNEVVEVLTSNYIIAARAKGASEFRILIKHVFRNVSIPMVTIVLPRFIFLIMGSLVIEMFFNVPGSAHVFSNAVHDKEIDVILFSILFFTTLTLAVQILVDVIYGIIDPRVNIYQKNNNFIKSLFIKIKISKKIRREQNE